MNFHLGLKTDPINTRYSFPWLFDLLAEEGIRYLQMGSFFELYSLEPEWFASVREAAKQRNLQIKSLFTAHRELGGFFYDDPAFEKVARHMCERFLQVGAWLGVDYVGWNPGAVHRDKPNTKDRGLDCFHRHIEDLMSLGAELGLKALCLEPMSSLAEPPSTPDEISDMMSRLAAHYEQSHLSTIPVYLCGDISHGLADRDHNILFDNWELFEHEIPWLAEFHFKNTDPLFNSTFGFSPEERQRGIVDLQRIQSILNQHADSFPVNELVGYLEIGGPKIGRDYSDPLLADSLRSSIRALKDVF